MHEYRTAIWQGFCAVKIASLAAKAIAWLLTFAFCAAVMAEPKYRLEPIPQTEPLPPAHEQSIGNAAQDEHAPVDARPVVEAWTVKRNLCTPCGKWMDWHKSHGHESKFRFEIHELDSFNELPGWALQQGTPAFRFEGGGKWWSFGGWHGEDYLATWYAEKNPVPMLAAPPAAPWIEQAHRFLGDTGTFTIAPAKPIKATLQDGTIVSYSRINASWKASGDSLTVTFDKPLPEAQARFYGIWMGLQFLNGSTDGNTVSVRTTKGSKVIRIQLEDAK